MVAFGLSARNGFVYDDTHLIVENPYLEDGSHLREILTTNYWRPPNREGTYRPLTSLSFLLDRTLFGRNPAGYHLENVLLHAGNSALVLAIAALLGMSPGAAIAAGLLFAIHPAHSEPVLWAVGRAEVLATFFALAAFALYLRARGRPPSGAGRSGRGRGRRDTVLAGILLLLGLLSKETAAVVPLLVFLHAAVFPAARPDSGKKRDGAGGRGEPLPGLAAAARASAPYFVPLGAYLALRFAVLHALGPEGTEQVFHGAPLHAVVLTMVRVFGEYVRLLLVPDPLRVSYRWDWIAEPLRADVLLSAGAVLAYLAACAGLRRRPLPLFALAWFGVALLPSLNVIPTNGLLSERRLYIPSVSFALLLPLAWGALPGRLRSRRAAGTALAAVALLYTGLSIRRTLDWRDEKTLWTATLRRDPANPVAHYNLGVALDAEGDATGAFARFAEAARLDSTYASPLRSLAILLHRSGRSAEALAQARRAIALEPGDASGWGELGVILESLGRGREAEAAYREALRLAPGDGGASLLLGTLLLQTGRPGEAVSIFQGAVPGNPAFPDLRVGLGRALAAVGRLPEAEAAFAVALGLDPESEGARLNLGFVLLRAGRFAEAAGVYGEAVRRNPGSATAWNGLAYALGRVPGREEGAIEAGRRSVALNPKNGQAYDTVADILLRSGRRSEAREWVERGLAEVPGEPSLLKLRDSLSH